MSVEQTKLPKRDFKMDADWLRTVADCADKADPAGNQRLWPETRENLRDIAAYVERLAEQPKDAVEGPLLSGRLRNRANLADPNTGTIEVSAAILREAADALDARQPFQKTDCSRDSSARP